MSFPRYPSYRPTDVERLGDIPNHWKLARLKRLVIFQYGDALPTELRDIDGAVYVFGSNGPIGTHSAANTYAPTLLIGRKGSCGALNWSNDPVFAIDTVYFIDERSITADLRWIYWCLHTVDLNEGSQDTGVPGLSREYAHNLIVSCPTPQEQQAISAFLDRETAKIDALVAEQEKLIELLKEKRQAVISHAVTKGLDPNVPMKDSGVDWLGIVPEHWHVSAVSYRYEVQLGKMLDSSKVTGKHLRPYLRVLDVQWGEINTIDLPQMDFDEADRQKFLLQPGDLLVNEGGSYVGRSAVWSGVLDECYFQKALHRLRAANPDKDSSSFFLYVMEFATKLGVFVAGGNQTTIDHLTAESLRRYRFAFPPYQEQLKIAQFLEKKCNKYDLLIRSASDAIILLSEKRSALISAAVTGKIDVRGLVDAEAA